MLIRKASIKDVNAIHGLIVTNLTQVNVQDYPDDVIEFMIQYYNTTQIEKWILEKRIFLVAFSDDILVGTVMLDNREVKGLYVNPSFHGKGVGKKIMTYLEQQVIGETLELYASITAYSFYKKIGYTTIEEVVDPQMGRAYLMRKDIKHGGTNE